MKSVISAEAVEDISNLFTKPDGVPSEGYSLTAKRHGKFIQINVAGTLSNYYGALAYADQSIRPSATLAGNAYYDNEGIQFVCMGQFTTAGSIWCVLPSSSLTGKTVHFTCMYLTA